MPHVEAGWRSECLRASTFEFDKFRQLPNITYVTENYHAEHVAGLWGKAVELLPRLAILLPDLAAVDRVGTPNPADIADVDGYPLSGCAAHSAFRAAQIVHLHGDRAFHIAEIGGGYGSLAMVLHLLGLVKSYTGFDLPEPSQLQKRYLDTFGFPFTRWQEVGGVVRQEWDLSISCASLSELSRATQDFYGEAILYRSLCGFHVWNWTREGWEIPKSPAEDLAWLSGHVSRRVQYCPNLGWDAATWEGVYTWGSHQ